MSSNERHKVCAKNRKKKYKIILEQTFVFGLKFLSQSALENDSYESEKKNKEKRILFTEKANRK